MGARQHQGSEVPQLCLGGGVGHEAGQAGCSVGMGPSGRRVGGAEPCPSQRSPPWVLPGPTVPLEQASRQAAHPACLETGCRGTALCVCSAARQLWPLELPAVGAHWAP